MESKGNKKMPETAIDRRLSMSATEHQIQKIVNNIYHHALRDFIARANEQEVLDLLYKFYTESDLTLISKQQLEVYQQLEKHTLSLSAYDAMKVNKNG